MSFIESTISEQHYIKGELLIDNNAVLELLQIEKNLWSVMIKDIGIIEVEIQNPNKKNQKSTCECKIYKEEKSCSHIAAALLHLRKLDSDKQEAKKLAAAKLKISRKKRNTSSFNIKTVLDHVDSDQLKKYIRTYAQTDKTFSTLFKAAFAKNVNTNDNLAKYQSILNTHIKPISTEKLRSSASDLRIGMKVVEEFHSQLEDNMSLSLFEDAFIILEATLPKLHYIYSKYEMKSDKIIRSISRFHNNLDLLYGENLAPTFQERIDAFIIELSERSYFNYLQSSISLYQILSKNKRKVALQKLITIIKDKKIGDMKEDNQAVFGAILVLNQEYNRLEINDDVILKSIQYLLNNNNNTEAIEYLEYFFENKHRNRKLETVLIQAYDKIGADKKYESLAIEIFVKYSDIKYYKLLKNKIPVSKWSKIRKSILKLMARTSAPSTLRASFYYNEEMNSELIKLLLEESDIRHIMKYDQYLYRKHFIALEEVYHKAIAKYLDAHVGSISTNFVQEVFAHLSISNAYKMELSLKKYISTHYPHRSGFITFS